MDSLRDIIDRFFTARGLVATGSGLVAVLVVWFGMNALLSSGGSDPVPPPAQAPPAPDPPVAESPPPVDEPEPGQPALLVARRHISREMPLAEALVAWRRPTAPLPAGLTAIREDATPLAQLRGALVTRPHQAGEPIAWENIVLPGEAGFLAATLSKNKRAVTLEANRAVNSANLILPGDRVDLIVVSGLDRQDGPLSQVIAANARVLAVGSTTVAPDIRRSIMDGVGDVVDDYAPSFTEPSEAGSYTLEVSSHEAQAIALITAVSGQLTLALRGSFADSAVGGAARPLSQQDLAPPLPTGVQIIRGRVRTDEPVAAAGAGA